MDSPLSASKPQPPRAAWRRVGRGLLWIFTILVLVASVFGAYWKSRYQTAVARAEAAGSPRSWEDARPKPVPDSDNFGALEDFRPYFSFEPTAPPPGSRVPFKRSFRTLDPKGMEFLTGITPVKVSKGSSGSRGPFSAASLSELRAKAVEERRLGEDLAGLSDAEALLKVYENLDPLWQRLHGAKDRTHAVLFVPSELDFEESKPPMSPFLALSGIAQQKARAHIAAGRGAEALEECLLLFKLADLRTYQSYLHLLIHLTNLGLQMPVLHEGLSRQVWNDAQLVRLEQSLARYDLLESLRHFTLGEMHFARSSVDWIRTLSGDKRAEYLRQFTGANELLRFLLPVFSNTLADIFGTYALESCLSYRELLAPERRGQLRKAAEQPPSSFAEKFGTAPALLGIVKSAARTQTLVNLARVAIALERFRLRNARFPAALEELQPTFLPEVPVEVLDGESLHYLSKNEGRSFTLYSTGWIGTDEGGAIHATNPNSGNLTWSTP